MLPEDLQVLVPYKDLAALLQISKDFEAMQEQMEQFKRELDGCRLLISQTQDYAKQLEKML